MTLKLPKDFQPYKPYVNFLIESDSFYIKIAETEQELLGAFHLRHNIFYKEKMGKVLDSKLDVDYFDKYADHLVIINKTTKKVMGTCRFTSSLYRNKYYIQTFFNIDSFLENNKNNKIEIGRVCLDHSLRSSQAIHFLWLGFVRYFRKTFSKYMFGCISIFTPLNKEDILGIYQYCLKKQHLDTNVCVPALPKYSIKKWEEEENGDVFSLIKKDKVAFLKKPANTNIISKLPRLFLWYLNMGSKIHSPMIYDPNLNTHDLFMSLDFKYIANAKLVDHYEDAVYLKTHLPH